MNDVSGNRLFDLNMYSFESEDWMSEGGWKREWVKREDEWENCVDEWTQKKDYLKSEEDWESEFFGEMWLCEKLRDVSNWFIEGIDCGLIGGLKEE